ncbi:oxidoreductase-like domain-containing protein [Craterilacuibacter sp.]|uniref:oxidoreductase-like domain-containing protein n=1 Tax=Craterilacuibacter sp. TaxID=2870909 RepID=UPI003F3B42D0
MADVADDFDPRPEAPIAPSDDMCCGSGCEPCVWDTYRHELAGYRVCLAAWQSRQEFE